MIDQKGCGGNLTDVGDPLTSRRSGKRSRKPLLLAAFGLGLVTTMGGGAVLWLAVHVLTGAPDSSLPLVDGVDLLKAALSVGLSKWTSAAQAP